MADTLNKLEQDSLAVASETGYRKNTSFRIGNLFYRILQFFKNLFGGTYLLGEKENATAIKSIANPTKGDTWRAMDTDHYWTYDGKEWNDIGIVLPSDAVRSGGSTKTLQELDNEKADKEVFYSIGSYSLCEVDNPQVIANFTSKEDARLAVPLNNRKSRLTLVYRLNEVITRETFFSDSTGDWLTDYFWVDERQEVLNVSYSIGYYILCKTNNPQEISNFETKNNARSAVPANSRKSRLTIVYKLNNVITRETFFGDSLGDWLTNYFWIDERQEVLNTARNNASVFLSEGTQSLQQFKTRNEARRSIPAANRRIGQEITYRLNGATVRERFTGTNTNYWLEDPMWRGNETAKIFSEKLEFSETNIGNYVKGVICTSMLNLGLNAIFDFSGNTKKITFYVGEYDNNGGFIEWRGRFVDVDISTLKDTKSTVVELDKYSHLYKESIYIVLDVNRMLNENFPAKFSFGTTNNPVPYSQRINVTYGSLPTTEELNSLSINKGKYYPFTNVPSTWVNHSAAIRERAKGVFAAIRDIQVVGGNPHDNFVYAITLISKNRPDNNWGNGIMIAKIERGTTNIVANETFRGLTASGALKAELDKIALNIPLWVSLNAFDLTFKILIDGTTLDAVGEIGVQSNQPLWGAYIDESCYVSAESGGENGITDYASLFDAAGSNAKGVISIGQSLFKNVKPVEIGTHATFRTKDIEEGYPYIGYNRRLTVKNWELKRISYEGIDLKVCSFSDDYIYYIAKDLKTNNTLYRALKESPEELIKIVFPSTLPNQSISSPVVNLIELNDGDLIIEAANGEIVHSGKRRRNVYRVNNFNSASVQNDTITVQTNQITHLFTQILFAEILNATCIYQCGEKVILTPYGQGKVGVVYYSDDYFKTFKRIFNMDVAGITIDTKPNGAGGFGAQGAWPTPESLTPVMPSTMWDQLTGGTIPNGGTGGNGNMHIHSCAYDQYYDRIWIVTGDVFIPNSYTAVWYTDDFGYQWHRIELRAHRFPFTGGTQFMTILPMPDCVLFSTDGEGDGFYRYNRLTKDTLAEVEFCYQYTEENTNLTVVGAGSLITRSGVGLQLFNPDEGIDYQNYKGGLVATANGYSFEKIFEDKWIAGTKETCEIDWLAMITEDAKGNILISANNGGIIKLKIE